MGCFNPHFANWDCCWILVYIAEVLFVCMHERVYVCAEGRMGAPSVSLLLVATSSESAPAEWQHSIRRMAIRAVVIPALYRVCNWLAW